jgi:hypothetical protein
MFRENKCAQLEVMKRIPKLICSLMKTFFVVGEDKNGLSHFCSSEYS